MVAFLALATSVTLAAPSVAAGQPGQALHPEWSPDGRFVAYHQLDGDDAHIWIVGPDGRPLRATRGPGYRSHPTWSPESDRLAFVQRDAGADPDIWILEVESGTRTRLTGSPARETHPAWSPDGERLAFVALEDGSSDLWSVGVDGTGLRRLAETPEHLELHPAWSRDGAALVYDTGDRETRWVEELILETGERRALTDPARHGSAGTPAWDATRRAVVLTRYAGGQGDLWRLGSYGGGYGGTPDGTSRESWERLTELPGDTGAPSVAPDGRNLVFHSDHEGSYAVYLLRVESGEVVRLSEAPQASRRSRR